MALGVESRRWGEEDADHAEGIIRAGAERGEGRRFFYLCQYGDGDGDHPCGAGREDVGDSPDCGRKAKEHAVRLHRSSHGAGGERCSGTDLCAFGPWTDAGKNRRGAVLRLHLYYDGRIETAAFGEYQGDQCGSGNGQTLRGVGRSGVRECRRRGGDR